MRRRRRNSRHRSSDTEALLLAVLLFIGTVKLSETWLIGLVYGALIGLSVILLAYSFQTWRQITHRTRLALLAEVNLMGGLEFEAYVAELLRRHGYRHVSLTEPSDMGVDIIAEKNGERWGVQTKRCTGRVGDFAVKQVVAGLRPYRCSRAMVITNSTYTNRAKKLGRYNDCVMVDRIGLARLIRDAGSEKLFCALRRACDL